MASPNEDVLNFTIDEELEQAREPVFRATKNKKSPLFSKRVGVGPGLSFGRRFRELNPDKVIILLPAAKGSSSIDDWMPGQGENSLFQTLVRRCELARAYGEIAGLVWYQGEKDLRRPAEWRDGFLSLVAAVREHFGARLPVVYTRIGDLGARYDHLADALAVFRGMQDRLVLPDSAMVDAGGLEVSEDGVHLTARGGIELGVRYAEAMTRLLGELRADSVQGMAPATS